MGCDWENSGWTRDKGRSCLSRLFIRQRPAPLSDQKSDLYARQHHVRQRRLDEVILAGMRATNWVAKANLKELCLPRSVDDNVFGHRVMKQYFFG